MRRERTARGQASALRSQSMFKLHKPIIKTGLISRLILKIFFLPKNECRRPRQSDGN